MSTDVQHPANELPIIVDGRTCGDCLHYCSVLSRCMVSRETPTVGPDWPACPRYLPPGLLGRALRIVKRRPLMFALPGLLSLLGYPLSLLLHVR